MNAVATRSGKWPWITAATLSGVALVAAAILFAFEPGRDLVYPVCIFHLVTGWQCPACGSLRALHQLLHGHVLAALHFNPLIVLALLAAAVAFGRRALRRATGDVPPMAIKPLWVWSAGVVALLFGIARNLPFAPFNWLCI